MDDVAGFGDNKIDLGTIDVRGAAIFDDAIRNRLIWHDASMSAAVGRKDNGTQPRTSFERPHGAPQAAV
jgi:hypothetical protein